jgi:hypothetical protein
MPSAIVVIVWRATGRPVRSDSGQAAAPAACAATTRTPRQQRLDRDADAGDQSAPAGADHDGARVGALLGDLEPGGPLPGDDVDVVEGVDQHSAVLLGKNQRRQQRLVDGAACVPDLGAVPLGGGHLRDRRGVRHEHRRPRAEQLCRERHALGVVAGARGDHAPRPLGLGQPGDAHVGAADLERPGALQVLALEQHGAADLLGQPAQALQRRLGGDAAQQLPRSAQVVERDGQRVDGGHGSGPVTAARSALGGRLTVEAEAGQQLVALGAGGGAGPDGVGCALALQLLVGDGVEEALAVGGDVEGGHGSTVLTLSSPPAAGGT